MRITLVGVVSGGGAIVMNGCVARLGFLLKRHSTGRRKLPKEFPVSEDV